MLGLRIPKSGQHDIIVVDMEQNLFKDLGKRLFLVVAFVVFSNLYYDREFGALGFMLRMNALILLVLAAFYDRDYVKKARKIIFYLFSLLFFIDLTIFFRASLFLKILFSFSLFGFFVVATHFLANKIYRIESLLDLAFLPLRSLRQYLEGMAGSVRAFLSPEYRNRLPRLVSLFIGLLISLPVVMIILILLTAADPIFASYTKDLLKTIPGRIFYSFFIGGLVTPIIFIRRREFSPILDRLPKSRQILEFLPVAVLVAIILGIFLIIQWPYVFVRVAAETHLSRFGVATYSEYVKRGFIELLIVSFIVYVLLWVGLLTLRKSEIKSRLVRNVQLILLLELLVFIFSIFRRVYLYFSFHGLSLSRIYGVLLLCLLTFFLTTLAARFFSKRKWLKLEVAVLTIFIIFAGIFNAEKFILWHPPTVNKRVDYVYLSRLSADGYPGWLASYSYASAVLDPQKYEKNKIISKEERRDIVYASYVVWQMLANYHNLSLQYSNQSDLDQYYKAIIENELKIRQDYEEKYKDQKANLGRENRDFQSSINDANTKSVKDLKEILADLGADKEKNKSKFRIYPTSYYYPQPANFESDVFDTRSLYEVQPKKSEEYWSPYAEIDEKKTLAISRFFNLNGLEMDSFERMKKDMPTNQLLKLYQNYIDLSRRIFQQPKGERKVEYDLSLQSPLL